MPQHVLTLWIIAACDQHYCDLTHLYARDEQDARQQALPWLRERGHLPEHIFRSYSHGFRIDRLMLPGVPTTQPDGL